MKKFFLSGSVVIAIFISGCNQNEKRRNQIAVEMEAVLKSGMLDKWYPQAMDTADGGFLSAFTFDFKPTGDHDKMIVTQARHTWTNAKASIRYPEVAYYKAGTKHGFEFLKNKMWDKTYGGF